jgi:hypothetical protein
MTTFSNDAESIRESSAGPNMSDGSALSWLVAGARSMVSEGLDASFFWCRLAELGILHLFYIRHVTSRSHDLEGHRLMCDSCSPRETSWMAIGRSCARRQSSRGFVDDVAA